MEDECLGACVF